MTTQKEMSLPDVLSELAKRLPHRIRAEMGEPDDPEPWVFRYEVKHWGWTTVWWGGDRPAPHKLDALEMTLREECDANGWHWRVGCGRAEVGDWDRRRAATSIHDIPGATPAHLLALALLEWLKILDVLNGTREGKE